MKKPLVLLLILLPLLMSSQEDKSWKKESLVFTPEIMFGKTGESNENFPDRNLQFQFLANIGRSHDKNPQEWAYWLKHTKTGVGLGYTNFGNLDSLGVAYTVIPFIEFNAFGLKNLKVSTGLGASYFTKIFDEETNPRNAAVSTDITWAFRSYIYYQLFSTHKIDWRIGMGYSHHSNGHTRLPNQGYNSFLVSLSADINNPLNQPTTAVPSNTNNFSRSIYSYVNLRAGIGQNSLTESLNDKKNVYVLSAEYGRVLNNTFKFGVGAYYRLYDHYYDYIKDNEALVQEGKEFEYFKEDPWRYATNIGLTINGEFLLNHIGLDLQLGYNLHKPAYKIDWRLNEGWDNVPLEIPDYFVLGEFNSKFKLKQQISSRLGLKYYLIGTTKAPEHNVFVGMHLNSNLGQADFTELSMGYVYNFNFRERKVKN